MLATLLAVSGMLSAVAGARAGRWTLEDIVTAPEILDLSVSSEGSRALYITTGADLAANRKVAVLHAVDLRNRAQRELRILPWLSRLEAVPGSRDWSVLADLGQGVQLYRVDDAGTFTPLIVNSELDVIGDALNEPRGFGVSDYGWSPDGQALWYVRRTAGAPGVSFINPAYLPLATVFGSNPVELRVRWPDGQDTLIARAETPGREFPRAHWEPGSEALIYGRAAEGGEGTHWFRWQASNGETVSLPHPPVLSDAVLAGPNGGVLEMTGLGRARALVERLPGGKQIPYGALDAQPADPRASGHWLAPSADLALVGARRLAVPRYGLLRIKASGALEWVPAVGSLTHCAVSADFSTGVCVEESMTLPPRIVRLDPRRGAVVPIGEVSPRHAALAPLKVVPRTWINRNHHEANGFIVYPRNYQKGASYPAILVTHGADADERFVYAGFQWSYPIQVWAERGYVVIAMNDPTLLRSPEIAAAYACWGGHGELPVRQVQELVWLDGVASFEDAIRSLVAEGLVDPQRVGIAGYSRGSQMVNVTMTQSPVFRAASSGDGGYLEPSGYFSATSSYRRVFGGSPYDSQAIPNYQRLSPTFRAAHAAGPILQQIAGGHTTQMELHVALREAGMPSEISDYPNESHVFHNPQNRLAAMQENLDWFDFWLRDRERSAPEKRAQYRRWRALRDEWRHPAPGVRE